MNILTNKNVYSDGYYQYVLDNNGSVCIGHRPQDRMSSDPAEGYVYTPEELQQISRTDFLEWFAHRWKDDSAMKPLDEWLGRMGVKFAQEGHQTPRELHPWHRNICETQRIGNTGKKEKSVSSLPAHKPSSTVDKYGRSPAAVQRDAAMRKEMADRKEQEAKDSIVSRLIPFLERHAQDWDECVAALFSFFGFRDGDFSTSGKIWTIDEDSISCTERWACHSFFDDGGGEEGYSQVSITYMPDGSVEDAEQITEEHYGLPRGYHSCKWHYQDNPFGLKGRYKICYDTEQENTD